MRRRTLLQSVAGGLFLGSVARLRSLVQAPTVLTDANITTLRALADVVLPSALGDPGRAAAVDRFVAWIRDYREGADRGHGYGASTLSQPSGPSPAARYRPQFAALDQLAKAHGATTFAGLPPERRREVVEAVLSQPERVINMPARPNGASLVADFMGYYFGSEGGYDLAYGAAIGRDTCRGLDGSDRPPGPPGKG
jgi:Gluconate 2-dehydrogenase subunit 3